ncbi:MAG TPA: choice-of-anchor tandem repeat GloVer-containing protein [Candidatus Cybelea sp.]
MMAFRLSRDALGIALGLVVLAGCGGGSHPLPTAGGLVQNIRLHQPAASPEKVLYRFKGGPDGGRPQGGLIEVNGSFYSTTYDGGPGNEGTVFSLEPSGKQRVIYSFKKPPDGGQPTAGLVYVNRKFYGTTSFGGYYDAGTVFAVDSAGNEQVVYSFKGGTTDGSYPSAALIVVHGTLYGTTESGGASSKGTVFALTTSGSEHVLYSFKGSRDGTYPMCSLLNVNGTLYGTASDYFNGEGWGTVFSVTTKGEERTLYHFKGPPDGATPFSSLLNVKGTFYGTTYAGGTNGWGTVFSINASGKEHLLYSFKGGADGQQPYAPLIDVKGSLFGTTDGGGGEQSKCDGCGTVFKVSTSGSENVVYAFQNDPDGAYPMAGLINWKGVLVGTSESGGYDDGTVFQITP